MVPMNLGEIFIFMEMKSWKAKSIAQGFSLRKYPPWIKKFVAARLQNG